MLVGLAWLPLTGDVPLGFCCLVLALGAWRGLPRSDCGWVTSQFWEGTLLVFSRGVSGLTGERGQRRAESLTQVGGGWAWL